jgi:hypothetical protein
MKTIKDLHKTNYKRVICYGSYYKPVNYKTDDCITGLIEMLCNYIKQIKNQLKDNSLNGIERRLPG